VRVVYVGTGTRGDAVTAELQASDGPEAGDQSAQGAKSTARAASATAESTSATAEAASASSDVASASDDVASAPVEVEQMRRGGEALDYLETATADCVVAETDLPDADGAELLAAVGELYPDVGRVLLAESVEAAPSNVEFVPTHPEERLPARVARRAERVVERRATERELGRLTDRFDVLTDRFETLVERSPDPILTIDETGRVVFANEAIERVFGVGPESVVGESVLKLLGEEVHDCFDGTLRDLVADEGTVKRDYVELPGEHADGHEVPLAVSFNETERDGDHYFSAIVRDVSERKRLEENLEAEKRKTRELHEVAVMLEACDTTEEVCRLAVETAEQLLEFDLAAVDTVEDGELVPQAVSKGVPTDGYYTTTPFDADDNLAARAYRQGESLRTANLHDEDVDPAASGYRAALSVPMADIGVFQAVSKEVDAFGESDRELAELLTSHVAQALQRIRSERKLEAERDRFAALYENTREAIVYYEMEDGDPVLKSVNEAFEEVFGYDAEEVVDGSIMERIVPEKHRDEARRHVEKMREGDHLEAEVERSASDGLRSFLLRTASVPGEESSGYVIYTDITERKERERTLDALHVATRDLMAAEGQLDICRTVVATARDVLDLPHATLFRWNDERELLEPYLNPADTVEAIGEAPAFEVGEGIVGDVFESGETEHFANAWEDPRAHEDGSEEIRTFGAFPLGDWGVLTISSQSVDEFDGYEIDLAKVLAANTEVALNRAAREAELADQRSQLAELDRINEVIRDVDQLLVRATTREEIVQAVCDRLADSDHYRFAWTGEAIAGAKRIEPTASAGVEDGYLDEVTVTYDEDAEHGNGPAGTAIRTGEVQVVQTIPESEAFESWRDEAVERGYRSAAAIPLRYRETVYGVLCIYAERANAFDAREQAVLAELGETIGHAINAAKNKKALLSDGVVEVEFDIDGGDGFFARVPQSEGGQFTLEGVTMTAEGSFVYFMTVNGLAPDRVLELADDADDVERARLVNEHDDGHLFEFVYTGPSPLQALADHGGTLTSATFTEDGGHSVIELPQNVDVRPVVEAIQNAIPDSEVVAQRERERPARTVEEFRTTLEDDLSERQRSALEAAFYAGFFEWPRESNGEEVSESLGVSPPTFHQHLRVGEKKLLSAFLDE
jgi:PAS domain S-box-containing protein